MKTHALDVLTSQFAPKGWRAKAPTKREAIRQLFSDGEPHSNVEMYQAAKTFRYGARLEELHRDSNHPLHYTRTADAFDDSLVWYRQATKSTCTVCKAKGAK